MILSAGFFFLFYGFNSTLFIATKVLKDNGFDNLGSYSLAFLYLCMTIGTILAPSIVYKLGAKLTLMIGSFQYVMWIIAISFTTISNGSETEAGRLNKSVVTAMVLITSALNGFGASMLWIA